MTPRSKPSPTGMVNGQIVLVTGAGSGIGRAVSLLFAEEGAAAIVLVGRTDQSLSETSELLALLGCESITVTADVSRPQDANRMVKAAQERFARLDSAVNCAGTAGPIKPLVDLSDDEWRSVCSVNLDGTFFSMRAEIPLLAASGGGAIVNVSSSAGINPVPYMAAYTASKFGIQGLGRAAAGESLSAGIRINTVQPGATRTGLLDQTIGTRQPADRGRPERVTPADPRDIAEPVVWLCSPRAAHLTGAEILANGGGRVEPTRPPTPSEG